MGKMLVFASALSAAPVMADDLVVDSHDHWQSFQNSCVLRAGRANLGRASGGGRAVRPAEAAAFYQPTVAWTVNAL